MKQMIVHCQPDVTQMALMENGKLVEFATERSQGGGLVGSFFKARVVNVLPGMQAAFVDIGQKKNAFLYIDDVLPPHLEKQPKVKPSITQLLHVGQDIIVQIAKEPLGTKGARVTTHYSLPGRWIVYMPYADYVAVSKKIERESERYRLKQLGEELRHDGEGLIFRTLTEDVHSHLIAADLDLLRKQWFNILQLAESSISPARLHQDLSMLQRLIRDAYTPYTDELILDNKVQAEEAAAFLQAMIPEANPKIAVYQQDEPIFITYGVQAALEKDLQRKVWLPSGGYIVWDQTEALTVIDVNTGKFTGGDNLEETVFQTNLQAAAEIARLIRLRDVGGIIIVDFIDMELEKHRNEIVELLEQMMKKDRTKSHVVGWTKLGLLEMTRKKVREETGSFLSQR
ncbi:Rne/Rng family ribonuclease [Paenibacillus sediminis]|uniref:Ribonuclease G n=1 Tax=Paenibacillus sediminis TaxID=664909 RepID=A0ABS4H720_9BACL|nr:Rne/Rng family ribonuclease [Paenibacillus sediminis]MBP1938327.1 ribonuclease G [Paenibacillus sediminis]